VSRNSRSIAAIFVENIGRFGKLKIIGLDQRFLKGTAMKKFILATLSFFILTMPWAFLWHVIWFHEIYAQLGAFTRSEPIMPLGMASVLIQGAVIAYLYPFYYRGGHPIVQGIKFSLIIGLMVYTMMGFTTAAKMVIEPVSTFLVYVTIYQLVQFIVTGSALGLIYGRICGK